ncbi:MAG TPA: single-stranded-DNA-specific exonuclease RecJ [Pseudomonadales bacterium]
MAVPRIVRRPAPQPARLPADLPPLVRRVLASRGITCAEQLDHGLARLQDPFLIKDMDKAVKRLQQALVARQRIIIVGDYDADGATSTALMMLGLAALGFADVTFEVPDRFVYGYGLSPAIVDSLAWRQPQLLITVDNGISSQAGVARANALGMDVIVTDHHLPGETLPEAIAILNPNQPDCPFPAKTLAGVGVAFHLLMALRRRLRDDNWFAEQGLVEPNLADFLDLVALGTVADVVPLDDYNRILVSQGIRRIRAGNMRPGIRQLLQVAGKNHRLLNSTDLGFVLGPRLNAAGRLDDMSQGIMLLMTDAEDLALELARVLDDFNRDRRQIERQMQQEALGIVEQMSLEEADLPRGLCLFHPDWHQGVVGLVASRLKEKYHRPVIAFAPGEAGELKGSGRSIPGIHLRDVLDSIAASHPGLLDRFGGHAMAAGMTLAQDQLAAFAEAFAGQLADCDGRLFEAVLESDGEVAATDLNLYTASVLRDVLPWGQQMPEPRFDGVFFLHRQRVVAEKHLKMSVSLDGNPALAVDAIWFNADASWLQMPAVDKVHLVYRMQVNDFRGELNLQLLVDSVSPLPDMENAGKKTESGR